MNQITTNNNETEYTRRPVVDISPILTHWRSFSYNPSYFVISSLFLGILLILLL